MPARISMPSGRTASTIASAQSSATLGLVNVATKPSPAVFDLAAAKPLEFVADDAVVVVEQVVPAEVAEFGGALSRADDIGENDCGEHTFGVEPAGTGDELLDLVENRRGVTRPVQRVGARQLDVARSRDVLGEIAAELRRNHRRRLRDAGSTSAP